MAKFTFQEAYNILKHDYNFFLEKDLTSDGNPTGDYDLDNLIIFTACRELLRRYKSKIKTTNDSTRVREIIKSNIFLKNEIEVFVLAGVKVDKEEFFLEQRPSEEDLRNMSDIIINNISLENTWDKLVHYYLCHGYNLDE